MNNRTNILAALILGAGAVAFAGGGCELIASVDRTKITGTGGGQGGAGTGGTNTGAGTTTQSTGGTSNPGGGGTTSTGGAGGTGGGTGGSGGCSGPSDCTDPGVDCKVATCMADTCGVGDAPDDTTCSTGFCFSGDCVECTKSSECTGNKECNQASHTCVSPACNDGTQNGAETDVDCGGPTCAPCGPNKSCLLGTDCAGGQCAGLPLKCTPDCSDGVKNNSETDVDCGGGTCPLCDVGSTCGGATDCLGGVCSGSPKKCQAPTCSDGVQNQGETAVDCGGPCGACNFSPCMNPSDCASNTCLDDGTGVKYCWVATCNDATKDGNESDVDCGGGSCRTCPPGGACTLPTDCLSGVCNGNTCM